MRGMIEVTLVRGGEESLSEVALRRRGRVSFIPSEFSIRRNARVATRFLLGGHICYTCIELIAAHFTCLRLVVRW